MKKILRIAALLLGAAIVFTSMTSCGGAPGNGGTDAFGGKHSGNKPGEVTEGIPENPERVAVLFSSLAQVWTLAGGSVDITVGEALDRGITDAPVIVDEGAGHSAINTELLIASRPDFVIGTSDYPCQVSAVEACASAGIPGRTYRIESLEDYLEVLREFCAIAGNPENYEKYGLSVKNEAEEIIKEASKEDCFGTVKYLFIRSGSSARSAKVKTAADHFACAMADSLGGVNIAGTETVSGFSLEEIILQDPEIIFIVTMGSEEASEAYVRELLSEDGWRELSAVKAGKVYFLDRELFHFKPNDCWAEAYAVLKNLLYEQPQE